MFSSCFFVFLILLSFVGAGRVSLDACKGIVPIDGETVKLKLNTSLLDTTFTLSKNTTTFSLNPCKASIACPTTGLSHVCKNTTSDPISPIGIGTDILSSFLVYNTVSSGSSKDESISVTVKIRLSAKAGNKSDLAVITDIFINCVAGSDTTQSGQNGVTFFEAENRYRFDLFTNLTCGTLVRKTQNDTDKDPTDPDKGDDNSRKAAGPSGGDIFLIM